MKITKTIFFFFFIANMNLMVRADEEDDFGELLLDFGSGMAVAACEADEACKSTMVTLTIPMLIIAGCVVCFGEKDVDYRYDPPSTKRIMTTGAGYIVGRQLFH